MENYRKESGFKGFVFRYSKQIYVLFISIVSFVFFIKAYGDENSFEVFEKRSDDVSIYVGSFTDPEALEGFLSRFSSWSNEESLNLYPPPYVKVKRDNNNMIVTWGPFEHDYAKDMLEKILNRWNLLAEIKDE